MKKTQILSAIALAFALGVVAPIAVAENASAVTEATDSADGTATVAEANAFKASVEGSKQYKALAALEAVKAPADTDEATIASSIVAAYNDNAITKANEKLNVAATLSEAVQAATNLSKYSAYAKAVHAIANVATNGQAAATAELEEAYQGITGEAYTYAAGVSTVADKYAAISGAVTGTDNYDKWSDLVAATDKGIALQQGIKDLKVALTTVNSDVQTIRNLASMKTYAEFKGAADAVLAGDQGTAYTTLKGAFANFKNLKDTTEADRKATYTTLKNLVDDVEDLYNKDSNSLTVSAIVAGYVAPVNPAKPGDSDVNAPATGIAGTAEGTATTVSIVAGLATALTALGAGVVAYRSARRK